MKDSVSNAKTHALRLIRYRGRSEKELTDRLALKGFSDSIVSETIKLLKKAGLINDPYLACSLTEIAKDVKLLGNRGVEYFLKKRGISKDIISGISIDGSEELERAKKLIAGKDKSISNYPLEKQILKIKGILLRRGYAFDTINRVINDLRKEHSPEKGCK
ncbi:regulatory protein RecX [bacterium BMS3Bbin05]|nr:regulatory protein RecX [bacterium BMS3Bbin05]HDL20002.1 hypothetical protein [Nitrospirota bacterium]HDO23519.1 hypothetical protein [Nitrospirota bacterium]HDZ87226.1 hypothetical protein [Nitrospirota bacterium]